MEGFKLEQFTGRLDDDTLGDIVRGYWEKKQAFPDDPKVDEEFGNSFYPKLIDSEYIGLFMIDKRFYPLPVFSPFEPGVNITYIFSSTKTLDEFKEHNSLSKNGVWVKGLPEGFVPVKIDFDMLVGMLKIPLLNLAEIVMDPQVNNVRLLKKNILSQNLKRKGIADSKIPKEDAIPEIMKDYNDAITKEPMKADLQAEKRKKEALARYLVSSRLIVPVKAREENRLIIANVPSLQYYRTLVAFSSYEEFYLYKTIQLLYKQTWPDDRILLEACLDDIVRLMYDAEYDIDSIRINVEDNKVVLSKEEILEIARNKDKYLN